MLYAISFDNTDYTGKTARKFLGGKGANLNLMSVKLGLPVPEGFTIPTGLCRPEPYEVSNGLKTAIKDLEHKAGKKFGSVTDPLFVSVRSGAPVSMPGMMETILNVGMNDKTVKALASKAGEDFAWDSYRRFIHMYAVTALDADPEPFKERFAAAKAFAGTDNLPAEISKLLVKKYREYADVPSDPMEQVLGAINAVFRSWYADKAVSYRDIEGISHDMGTAVNVQRMVFGNMNNNSGTGVVFTRNPNSGENELFGDFLVNAQGEDVVDGSHTTLPIRTMGDIFPDAYSELSGILTSLEVHFKDMCDVEFTVEDGKLYILQTRTGKRSSQAAVVMALDMHKEGLIDRSTATERIMSVSPSPATKGAKDFGEVIGRGTGASPGIVSGNAYFSWETAVEAVERGEDVILIRAETCPSDIKGMAKATGILTATGGLVSHAAVVARGWNKPCVVGFQDMLVLSNSAKIIGADVTIQEGDTVYIDGSTGEVGV